MFEKSINKRKKGKMISIRNSEIHKVDDEKI
jgi:hypothetical protein